MSKKKAAQAVTTAENLGAAGEGIPQSAMPTAPFNKGANEEATANTAAEDVGVEILRGAQDDNVLGAGQDNSPHQSPAVTASPQRGEAETGEDELLGDTEGRAKVRLIADKNGTVPEIKDGKILLRAAYGATVYANARRMMGCGVFVEIPAGYAGFILPSLRLRENWGLVCQGVRMPGESGEVSVTLINCGIRDCDIQPGEVIAEMVIVPYLEVEV